MDLSLVMAQLLINGVALGYSLTILEHWFWYLEWTE